MPSWAATSFYGFLWLFCIRPYFCVFLINRVCIIISLCFVHFDILSFIGLLKVLSRVLQLHVHTSTQRSPNLLAYWVGGGGGREGRGGLECFAIIYGKENDFIYMITYSWCFQYYNSEWSEAIIASYWTFGSGGRHRRHRRRSVPYRSYASTPDIDSLAHQGVSWRWPDF